jgi:hypothetical protein
MLHNPLRCLLPHDCRACLSASLRSAPERDNSPLVGLFAQNIDCVPEDIPIPNIRSHLLSPGSPGVAVSTPGELDAPRCCVSPTLSPVENTHCIHHTSPGSPLLKPRRETAIQLYQVAKVLPPFPAISLRFPPAHPAPQPLRQHPVSQRLPLFQPILPALKGAQH